LGSEQNYSRLDRMFHRLAFSGAAVQLTAADVEQSLYGRRFRALPTAKPVFITSLPRAGTTLMLEILGRCPALATYSYRDMPFVLAPLLWEGLSRNFRKPAVLTERAHADGMRVGYDSPEAFEEVLWRALWPAKFAPDGITLWAADEDASEFREAFVSQMQRIIAVRSNGHAGQRRYLSKNNANIARLGFLKRLCPDAVILVPFRRPVDQAASLLRQHLRFLEIHRTDAFARQYMEDIGHLEFGALHRPIRFPGMDIVGGRHTAESLDYWIAYWIAAFAHILRHAGSVVLVCYERLCQAGSGGIQAIAAHLDLPQDAIQEFEGAELRAPRAYGDDTAPDDQSLVREANELYRQLSTMSIV
jgi:hypothetical protein